MRSPLTLALIYGSSRDGRFCDTIANWAANEIWSGNDFILDLIDPVELDLPLFRGQSDNSALVELRKRLDAADAFLVVTPEYNHGYPAPLKLLIDSAYREWQAKPVAFVSYGGISGGLRAVEQLRLVFAELHAVTLRDSVSFANPWTKFGDDGRLLNPDEPRAAMATMLSRLRWWAQTLHDARKAAPYTEVAA